MSARWADSERGFTLLEVLVSFVVLALVLGAAYQSFSAGTRAASRVDERLDALTVAESVLARAGRDISLSPGQFEETLGSWGVRVLVEEAAPADRNVWTQLGNTPVRVTVEVFRAGQPVEISLTTLKVSGAE